MANVVDLTTQVTNNGTNVFYLTEDAPPVPSGGDQTEIMSFSAPTTSNTTIVAVTAAASAQQLVPQGKHTIYVTCTSAFLILFGAPGAVPTPSAANALALNASTLYEIETSNGANAWKVIRQTADGTLSWTLNS